MVRPAETPKAAGKAHRHTSAVVLRGRRCSATVIDSGGESEDQEAISFCEMRVRFKRLVIFASGCIIDMAKARYQRTECWPLRVLVVLVVQRGARTRPSLFLLHPSKRAATDIAGELV